MKSESYRMRRRDALWSAWEHVRDKAKKSQCSHTVAQANEFALHAQRNLLRIASQLRQGKFVFQPQQGILLSKPGKTTKRPIVVAPVASRVVQRALLDVVQANPAIDAQLKRGYNFGGVVGKGFGVPAAVRAAWMAAQHHSYFIRTDIRSFFTQVPRAAALSKVTQHVTDPAFNALLKVATDVELDDVSRMGDDVKLFPLFDEGVAQGSCLSPMLCNLLLDGFDQQMNGRGIVCVRYIDDFIIFARNKSAAFAVLDAAKVTLGKLGLGIYDPRSSVPGESAKSEAGPVSGGFAFLGCEIKGDRIRPSKANRDELKNRIKKLFDAALGDLVLPAAAIKKMSSFADVVHRASLTVRGWGNTHSFCTDDALMMSLDLELTSLFSDYQRRFNSKVKSMAAGDARRAQGLFMLEDCNTDAGPGSIRWLIAQRQAANEAA